MMLKQISYRKIMICIGAAVAVIVVAVIVLLLNKEETFRSILVYDVEGNAVIERETVGSMDAAENLYLESGDRVSVAADSSMRMKLDDDKYVMAEADTIFSVEAQGTDADSRTRICLEQGAITNEIQHPLSEGSQYETSTPNSVMAVRGTIYRVELYVDEQGEQNTKLCCFQGKVGTKPILPDGTYGEEVLVPAGSELTIYEDGTVDDMKEIAYDELPGQAVENLIGLSESGQSLTGISLEDLRQLSAGTKDEGKAKENEPEKEESTETVEAASQSDAAKETDAKTAANTEAVKSGKGKTGTGVRNPAVTPAQAEQSGQQTQVPAAVVPNTPAKAAEPVSTDNAWNNNAGGEEDNTDSDAADNGSSDNDEKDDEKPDRDKPDKEKPDHDRPSRPVTYTVTFTYQGKTFAAQEVVKGAKVSEPVLLPDAEGEWDFDFETKIEANTTIAWKE